MCPPGAGMSVLRLLRLCTAVHPTVSKYQSAALWPEVSGPGSLQLHPARWDAPTQPRPIRHWPSWFQIGRRVVGVVISPIYCHASTDLLMAPRLGALVLFLAFFALLHCWLNAFAEMLRFADRMFYKVRWIGITVYSLKPERCDLRRYFESILVLLLQDWWNSTSFANYYRTWNVVVHDWLYYYVYRDFLLVSKRSLDEEEVRWYMDTTYKVKNVSHYHAIVTPVFI